MKLTSTALLALSGTALSQEWGDWQGEPVVEVVTRTVYTCPCSAGPVKPWHSGGGEWPSNGDSTWQEWAETTDVAGSFETHVAGWHSADANGHPYGAGGNGPAWQSTYAGQDPYPTAQSGWLDWEGNVVGPATTTYSNGNGVNPLSTATTTTTYSNGAGPVLGGTTTTTTNSNGAGPVLGGTTTPPFLNATTTTSGFNFTTTTTSVTTTSPAVAPGTQQFNIIVNNPRGFNNQGFGGLRKKDVILVTYLYFPVGSNDAELTTDITLAAAFSIDANGNLRVGNLYINLDSAAGYTPIMQSTIAPAATNGGWTRNSDGTLTDTFVHNGFCVGPSGLVIAELTSSPGNFCTQIVLLTSNVGSTTTTTTTTSFSFLNGTTTGSTLTTTQTTATTATTSVTTSTTASTSTLTTTSSTTVATTTTSSAGQPGATTFVTKSSLPDYQTTVLQQHNIHRANHSAVDLVWNTTMAAYAQQIASTCVYAHSRSAGDGNYGQNIGAGYTPDSIAFMITNDMYNGEIGYYPTPYGNDNPDLSNFGAWGHFSQIVWSDTLSVGCATQYCPGGLTNTGPSTLPYFTVCNFYPAGNFIGSFSKVKAPRGDATVVIVN